MRRPRVVMRAALCAAALVAVAVVARDSGPPALAQSPTAPAVTLTAPLANADCGECIDGDVALRATATASSGRTITSVAFEYAPANTGTWTPIETLPTRPSYATNFDTRTVPEGLGVYDIRAVATDSAGEQSVSLVRDRVVNNNATFVRLMDPGELLPGTVSLQAISPTTPAFIYATSVRFQYSPAGAEQWTDIGTDIEGEYIEAPIAGYRFTVDWNSTVLPEGRYDLRALPSDVDVPSQRFISRPQRDRLVDATAPVSLLAVPPAPLRGAVTLSASAQDTSGIASVRFERSPAGSDSWSAIGTRTRAPYTFDFDTRIVEDGEYDLRAVVTDRAGNAAPSPAEEAITISNPGRVPPGERSVTSTVAPAGDLHVLGTTGSGETWAWGTSTATPPLIDGRPLPYTAPGRQLVLLSHTEASGWQIRDVLRDEDGAPFRLASSSATRQVVGQMAPSGEAWIGLRQDLDGELVTALFHRSPDRFGGQFRRDAAASAALGPLMRNGLTRSGLTPAARLQVGEDGSGRIFGLLLAPTQDELVTQEPTPDGTATVRSKVRYGLLDGDTWQLKTLPRPRGYTPRNGDSIQLRSADLTGPRAGWVAVDVTINGVPRLPPRIGRLGDEPWDPIATGLDVLDLTDAFATNPPRVLATGLRADRDGVWIGADVSSDNVVAYYDATTGDVTRSWCEPLGRTSLGCGAPLDSIHPATLPDQIFQTERGPVAVALRENFIHIFEYGDWSRAPAPGFNPISGNVAMTSPDSGWLGGSVALGRVALGAPQESLATWPQSNRSTLLSVALPPGSSAAVAEPGALAVGLDGTALAYDAAAGWQVQPTPARASRQALRAVAFSGPSQAFAVGASGMILRWDGAAWTEDPQSTEITNAELQGLAFARDGRGWAVGRFGTILHYDGSTWAEEQPPAEDAASGAMISSVTVAGDEVFAIADGNLIVRGAGGQWRRVPRAELPEENAAELPFANDLRLVSGLPDGGVVAAGRSVVLTRQRPGAPFEYAAQPIEGVAVALSAFRDRDGAVRAFASAAATVRDALGNDVNDIGGFPSGDGVLLRQTPGGWLDLSHSQPPARSAPPPDGLIKPDPVLAVATSADGQQAWAVGGYAGTRTAAGFGTDEILQARARGWRTAHIWRYDAGGSAQSPADVPVTTSLPARPNTVTFAFFSSAKCKSQCSATQGAQPDVNLEAAARAVNEFAQQPGGPAFAVLGGDARGPSDLQPWLDGNGADDFLRLPSLLRPLERIPLFAAYGQRDAVPNRPQPARPWADAFAQASAPFGSREAAPGITPVSAGRPVGAVHRYYAFDAEQNGAMIRAIVVDNSDVAIDAEQRVWLREQLASAKETGRPIVVFASQPLTTQVELLFEFVDAGVTAIFAGGETNGVTLVPVEAGPEYQFPQFTGAALGYQRTQNNGVAWYQASVDVQTGFVTVDAIPVMESLALRPLLGLTARRSGTLAFEAVGRRPTGTLATTPFDPTFPGFDNYANIPAPACVACITPLYRFNAPSYRFESADPTIGDFVVAQATGSRYPMLDQEGRPIRSATSGLFCAYNSGTTTVSIIVGTRKASLPVTVLAGGFGRPCGTVFREGQRPVITIPGRTPAARTSPPGGTDAPPGPAPDPGQSQEPAELPNLAVPFPPPPVPDPAPPVERPPTQREPAPPPPPLFEEPPLRAPPPQVTALPPVALPLIPPNIQPIPPGGAASAQAAARRKEKVRQHASQSAFTTHVPGETWFYGAVGVMSVLTLLLVAGGVRPGPRQRPAHALLRLQPTRPRDRR